MDEETLFFAELDDDCQDLLKIDERALLRRAYCYVLLADGLIIHPAYIWQSLVSHKLILDTLAEIFRPPLTQVALGDSDSISGYMAGRIQRLQAYKVRETTRELRQYARWEADLVQQAKALDAAFQNGGSVTAPSESRDLRFRALLKHDLEAEVDPSAIRTVIREHATGNALTLDIQEICDKLRHFVDTSPLVSVDTFATRVRSHGLPHVAESHAFKQRMLLLYYEANVDLHMTCPASAPLSRDRIVNFYDSNVFWTAFQRVFGTKAARTLSEHTDPRVVRVIRDLRDTELWRQYRSVYFQVLKRLDAALWENAKTLANSIKEDSGQKAVRVVRRLWRNEKRSIVAAVFGLISISTGSVISVLPGVLSLLFGAHRLVPALKKFVQDYHSHDLTQLQQRIDREVEKVLSQANGSQAYTDSFY